MTGCAARLTAFAARVIIQADEKRQGVRTVFRPVNLRVNHQRLENVWDDRRRVVEGPAIELSWAAASDAPGAFQTAYCLTLFCEGKRLLDTDWIESREQRHVFTEPLPRGKRIDWTLCIRDNEGHESDGAEEYFYVGDVGWTAPWIAPTWEDARCPAYFRRAFGVDKPVKDARLYVCGLGYHSVTINGEEIGADRLEPVFSDYSKTCYYSVYPGLEDWLEENGENTLSVTVAAGWRANDGRYLKNFEKPAFFGPIQLSAMFVIDYEDGAREVIATDKTWQCGKGPITRSHLFDGETYDARRQSIVYGPVRLVDPPGGVMRPATVPPATDDRAVRPVSMGRIPDGWLVDFGRNIAGVVSVTMPEDLLPGQTITVRHAERLREDGTPYFDNLRGARATDTYIAAGRGRDIYWQPAFVYHGFRYALVNGLDLTENMIEAHPIHTDLDSASSFHCGSALINAIQDMVVRTERDNMHAILTDCPQRDERMGWMNDATVRFEETPYNFDATAMFRKICRDIADEQKEDGAIACTAPKVYGSWPADPVCSSFLVAGHMAWLHGGDLSVIREQFDSYARWENCLLSHSDGFIVNYSYYGDWAGPAYACESAEGAKSAVTPGTFMSTGYSYYNCRLLEKFARLLGRTADEAKYAGLAGKIAAAMLEKWYDRQKKVFATGSMACQAFALWLDLAPEDDRAAIAQALRDDLVKSDYRFTTGNLCTKYLLDELARFGYVDEAYALVTREDYPSWGWMIQNEATTVWERFELKDNGGMNSYCHPMYGAVGAWFYSALAGLAPLEDGWKRFSVAPKLPKKLMSCQATVDTPRGRVNIRWVRREGRAYMQLDVPFGAEAEVSFGAVKAVCASGRHSFCTEE